MWIYILRQEHPEVQSSFFGLLLLLFHCRRILRTNPPIPEELSPEVADFITKLLVKNPRERLGGGTEDAEELKRHPFFKVWNENFLELLFILFLNILRYLFSNYLFILKGLNWTDLSKKAVPAPFIPKISGELDVSNFSEEFTKMTPTDSPAIVPPNFDKIFKVSCKFLIIYIFRNTKFV